VKRAEDEFEKEGFKVIWMGFQDGKDKIMNFMTKHDIQSSVGYDERNMISSKYGIAYGAGLILIDRDGIVQKRIPKGFSEDELVEVLKGVIVNYK
jgi:cytochrome oxidase Cu insertion factor (SCO1/SenC/PrrC family)